MHVNPDSAQDLQALLNELHAHEETRLYRVIKAHFLAMIESLESKLDKIVTPESVHERNYMLGQKAALRLMLEPGYGLSDIVQSHISQARMSVQEFEELKKRYPKEIKTPEDAEAYRSVLDGLVSPP
jgi:hypothetical protein